MIANHLTLKTARVVLVLLSVGCMVWLLAAQWSNIRSLSFDFRPVFMALAVLGLVILFFLDAYGWHLVAEAAGAYLDPRDSIRIWMVSSLARYLPGGIWGYVSRAALCRERGVSLSKATLSLYLETMLLLFSSLVVGIPSVTAVAGFRGTMISGLLVLLLLATTLHPSTLKLVKRLPGRSGHLFNDVELPPLPQLFLLLLYYIGFWIGFGAAFLCFVLALQPLPVGAWLPVAATISFGFFVGFVAFFTPSGIGVRESAIYILLLPFLPPPACLLISIASRLWIMAGEIISATAATLFLRADNNIRNQS